MQKIPGNWQKLKMVHLKAVSFKSASPRQEHSPGRKFVKHW